MTFETPYLLDGNSDQRTQPETAEFAAIDGLTDLVPDEQIRQILASSDRPAKDLVEAALHAGGLDNVTAVVLQFEPS